MEPKVGQLWFSKSNQKYLLVKEVRNSSLTIDYEYLDNNKTAWCDLYTFKTNFKLVSG